MAAKRFHIARPDQLRALVPFSKDKPDTVARMARIWEAAKQKKGETRWDDTVFAGFCGTRRRDAEIVRVGADGEIISICTLMYNKALNYCEQNTRQVHD